eukprot:403349257
MKPKNHINNHQYKEYQNVLFGFEDGSLSHVGKVQSTLKIDEPIRIKNMLLHSDDRLSIGLNNNGKSQNESPERCKINKLQEQMFNQFNQFEKNVIIDQKYVAPKFRQRNQSVEDLNSIKAPGQLHKFGLSKSQSQESIALPKIFAKSIPRHDQTKLEIHQQTKRQCQSDVKQ